MDWTTIGGLVARHVLTTAAGALATYGLMANDPETTQTFVAAGMVFVGLGWSAWQKYGAARLRAALPPK